MAEPEERLDQGEPTSELRRLKDGGRGHRGEMLLAPPPLIANILNRPASRQEAAGSSKPEKEESFMKRFHRGEGQVKVKP